MEGFKQEGTLSNSGLSDTVLIAVWETVEKHKDKECIHQVGGGCLGMEVPREDGVGDTLRTGAGFEGGSREGVPRTPRFLGCPAGPVVETSSEIGMLAKEGWAWGKRRDEVFVGYQWVGEMTGMSGSLQLQSGD